MLKLEKIGVFQIIRYLAGIYPSQGCKMEIYPNGKELAESLNLVGLTTLVTGSNAVIVWNCLFVLNDQISIAHFKTMKQGCR